MKKLLKILAVLAVIGMIGVFVVISTMLGSLVKLGVETVAPTLTGAPVTLDDVSISLFSGDGSIKGLVVKNPEGFKTDSAIQLGEAAISIDVGSVLGDTIIIKEILIDGPQVTYEGTMETSNIKTIMANVKAATKSRESDAVQSTGTEPGAKTEKDSEGFELPKIEKLPEGSDKQQADEQVAEADTDKEAGAGTKLIIEKFTIRNGKINVSSVLLGGEVVSVPMPPINMTDIGKDSGGLSPAEAMQEVMGSINDTVGAAAAVVLKPLEALKKGQEALTEGAKKLGESIGAGGKELEEGASKLIRGIGGLFGGDK